MWNLFFVLGAYIYCVFISCIKSVNKTLKCSKILFCIIIFILIVCVAFRDGSTLNDYENYSSYYYSDLNDGAVFEPSFYWITHISRYAGSIFVLFFIYSFLGIGLKGVAIYKLTNLRFLTLCVYISNILILQDMTQIRAGVAAGFFLISIPYLKDIRKLEYLIIILIASLFHYSALLFLICCLFWIKKIRYKRSFLWLIIPICYSLSGTALNLNLIPFEPLRLKLDMYQQLQEDGVVGFTKLNIFNPYILFRIILYYFILWKARFIIIHNQYFQTLIFIESIALSIFPLFSAIPLLGYRGSELLGVVEIILYPLLIYCFKQKIIGTIFVILISALLLTINLTYKVLIKI